ncbi:hypothetical protein QL898_11770 [Psychrobacter sp. APC 3279]|uniref:hypothetical protein n=1 Tax=Psychrobacter sp. APC 3279 TaxID=3035189 RepID=UPI0025B2D559|nr:hypothetical protein [Psychrobacter sp. APC 3279]MDN3442312.1 hypothetical protein [Psychrobacter sp. APC 3279]
MMTSILHSLEGLAQRSKNVEYLPLGFGGEYLINTPQDLELLLEIQKDPSLSIKFDFKPLPAKEDFTLKKSYTFKITVKIPQTKSNFFSTPDYLIDYILGEKEVIDWSKKIVLPFSEVFYSDVCKYKSYFIYLNRLVVLYKKYAYWDSVRIVLFTDKPFIIPLRKEKISFDKLEKCFADIDISKFKDSIEYLEDFLDNETIEKHKKEKQSIFIIESSKVLGSQVNTRFYSLVKEIGEIEDSVDKSFKIYLENFSYKKLELELKKDLDYFIKSINDSIGALQSQALGLPVAVALTQFSKVGSESTSSSLLYTPYLALIAFSVFVAFNVYQQDLQVQYSKASIDRFFKKESVSSIVNTDTSLNSMRKLINKRIRIINIYMLSILILAILVIVYSLYELGLLAWTPS